MCSITHMIFLNNIGYSILTPNIKKNITLWHECYVCQMKGHNYIYVIRSKTLKLDGAEYFILPSEGISRRLAIHEYVYTYMTTKYENKC